jgi:hypothetical protein
MRIMAMRTKMDIRREIMGRIRSFIFADQKIKFLKDLEVVYPEV